MTSDRKLVDHLGMRSLAMFMCDHHHGIWQRAVAVAQHRGTYYHNMKMLEDISKRPIKLVHAELLMMAGQRSMIYSTSSRVRCHV